ncbi:MAG: translation elongation factor 4 [Patescibacteria group bacterium]
MVESIDKNKIRNFCIIAHINHGKSTLADRLLEETGTVSSRKMSNRLLDKMDLEKEKGITIKLKPVRMSFSYSRKEYVLNLVDTPGHVDFSYEVSRSLAACEGAILLVDAVSGIQAQTLANLEKARKQGLKILPVVNKIDLPDAQPEKVARNLVNSLGFDKSSVSYISAKTGKNVTQLLSRIVKEVSPPKRNGSHLQGLVFDSFYDPHRGAIAVVRLMNGNLEREAAACFLGTDTTFVAEELGYFVPEEQPTEKLSVGEVGYVVTGMKDISKIRVGDTLVSGQRPKMEALPGYREPKPMVFQSVFPLSANGYTPLKKALQYLHLSDSSFTFSPSSSESLGRGFQLGFLGALHGDIICERLRREFDLEILTTPPAVSYKIKTNDGETHIARTPSELPEPEQIKDILEPWLRVTIYTPEEYLGAVFSLCENRRGVHQQQKHFAEKVKLVYLLPMASFLQGFYNKLKSASSGYASLEYVLDEWRSADVVRLDILVHYEIVEPLSQLVLRKNAYAVGKRMVSDLKELLPPAQFPLALQAAIGSNVIARETIGAQRKNVTEKLYGGDRTRKDKLLQQQREGKKELSARGDVSVPADVLQKLWRNSE